MAIVSICSQAIDPMRLFRYHRSGINFRSIPDAAQTVVLAVDPPDSRPFESVSGSRRRALAPTFALVRLSEGLFTEGSAPEQCCGGFGADCVLLRRIGRFSVVAALESRSSAGLAGRRCRPRKRLWISFEAGALFFGRSAEALERFAKGWRNGCRIRCCGCCLVVPTACGAVESWAPYPLPPSLGIFTASALCDLCARAL